jgi:hypothetical protein
LVINTKEGKILGKSKFKEFGNIKPFLHKPYEEYDKDKTN